MLLSRIITLSLLLEKYLRLESKSKKNRGAIWCQILGGLKIFFLTKKTLKGLKSVIFPVCHEYWGGLSPPFWRIISFLPPNFGGA